MEGLKDSVYNFICSYDFVFEFSMVVVCLLNIVSYLVLMDIRFFIFVSCLQFFVILVFEFLRIYSKYQEVNMKENKKTRSITIRVSDIEYMKISSGAKEMGMTITQYINYLAHIEYMKSFDKNLLGYKQEGLLCLIMFLKFVMRIIVLVF